MVQLYADGALIYAPGLPGHELLGLTATVSASTAGTAEIVMPAEHPARGRFISKKTIVEIHRRGKVLFRGRALYPTDAFDGARTITCEGERGFFRDSVIQPYLYQAEPAVIFANLISQHNDQMIDGSRRFVVGRVTAVDPNGYVRLESESAMQTSEVIDKLVERVGGFITFETNGNGQRVVNWIGEPERVSTQRIEFGENLLDYSRTGANTDPATVIFPYGAKDEETKEYLTIEAVNGGRLYIQDDAAVALRGWIARPVYWDDVTMASNLLKKARAYLNESRLEVDTLSLSAFDLSVVDADIEAYEVCDLVPVVSKPHGVNDNFLLRERAYDFLEPGNDTITLGKDVTLLTRSDVSGDKNAANRLQRAEQNMANQQGNVVNNFYNSGGGTGGGAVSSVNGQTGEVELDASDVGAVPTGQGTEQQTLLFGVMTVASGATITCRADPENFTAFTGRLAYVGVPPASLQGANDAREIGISSISRYNDGLRIDYVSLLGVAGEMTKTVNIIRRVLIEADGTVKVSSPASVAIGPIYGVKTV